MIMKPDPLGVKRNPWQVMFLCIAVMNGFSTLIGHPTSRAMQDALTSKFTSLLGFILFFGGFSALMGMYWQGAADTGLFMKRIGYTFLSIGCFCLAAAAIDVVGTQSLAFGSIALAFGIISLAYAFKVDRCIRSLVRDKQRMGQS